MMKHSIRENSSKELFIFFGTLCSAIIMLIILMWVAPIPTVAAEADVDNFDYSYVYQIIREEHIRESACYRMGVPFADAEIWQPDQLNYDAVTNRRPWFIEMIIGICLDDEGNGIILNTTSSFNYVSYRQTDECGNWQYDEFGNMLTFAKAGDIIVSFYLYNPKNQVEDDIISAEFYVVDTNQLITEN